MMSDPIDLKTSRQSVLHVEFSDVNQRNLFQTKTFLTEDLTAMIQAGNRLSQAERDSLFNRGVTCKFLQVGGKNWQTGTLKITIQFHPDEPEPVEQLSPLDDIRQELSP